MPFDESKVKRVAKGSKGGGEFANKAVQEKARAERVARAKATHVVVNKVTQRYAEEKNEAMVAKALGGVSLPGTEPVDVMIPADPANREHWQKTADAHRAAIDAYHAGGRRGTFPVAGTIVGAVLHGLEVKTIVLSKKADKDLQLSMKADARARKAAWQRKNKQDMHTLAIDDRKVFNAHGPGQHDESKRVIYYARGFGNFRLASMHRITGGWKEVGKLMGTSYRLLPEAARKRPKKL